MVTPVESHKVALGAPWYAPARRVALHRYLDSNFVQLFQNDVTRSPDPARIFAWESEDSSPPDPHTGAPRGLKLRRPAHGAFHMVCWEAQCDIVGRPTVAPEKIISAGFVLRAGDRSAPQGFQIVQGQPQGWAPVESASDPECARELKVLGLVARDAATPAAYTGEETFPLHVLSASDGQGNPHTLLYGYLPLGGGHYTPPDPPAPDINQPLEELPWPFGLAGRTTASPPDLFTFDQVIAQGQVNSLLAAVLRVLLIRYGLAGAAGWSAPDNAVIVGLCDRLSFFSDPPAGLVGQSLRDWAAAHPAPGGVTLGSALRDGKTATALLASLTQGEPTDDVALPASAPVDAGARNLLVTEADAAQWRAALKARLTRAVIAVNKTLPAPKLVSGFPSRYFVQPFVRVLRPDGCECPFWGKPSEVFAVAAFFDTSAARPRLIEMPDLADAQAGLAQGATFNLPPKLADLVNSLGSSSAAQNLWKGSAGQGSGGLGLRFICSFSLPAIMICAMLMLSIVLSLLNIVFGWMAWVKICLPIPEKK
jgi:hypothetical protein